MTLLIKYYYYPHFTVEGVEALLKLAQLVSERKGDLNPGHLAPEQCS